MFPSCFYLSSCILIPRQLVPIFFSAGIPCNWPQAYPITAVVKNISLFIPCSVPCTFPSGLSTLFNEISVKHRRRRGTFYNTDNCIFHGFEKRYHISRNETQLFTLFLCNLGIVDKMYFYFVCNVSFVYSAHAMCTIRSKKCTSIS